MDTPLLLSSGRQITSRRKWGLRAVMVLFAFGGAQNIAAEGGAATAPSFATGTVAGLAVLYWLGLRILSTDVSPSDAGAAAE